MGFQCLVGIFAAVLLYEIHQTGGAVNPYTKLKCDQLDYLVEDGKIGRHPAFPWLGTLRVQFDPIPPICLPHYPFTVDHRLYSVGYTDENKELEKTMQQLDYVDKETCDKFYQNAKATEARFLPKHYYCGLAKSSNESCVWSSGMFMVSNSSGVWILIGISVNGPKCQLPDRFIDIHMYTSWIDSSIRLMDEEQKNAEQETNMKRIFDLEYIPLQNFTGIDDLQYEVSLRIVTLRDGKFSINKHDDDSIQLVKFDDKYEMRLDDDCERRYPLIYSEKTIITDPTPNRNNTVTYKLTLYDFFVTRFACIRIKLISTGNRKAQLFYKLELLGGRDFAEPAAVSKRKRSLDDNQSDVSDDMEKPIRIPTRRVQLEEDWPEEQSTTVKMLSETETNDDDDPIVPSTKPSYTPTRATMDELPGTPRDTDELEETVEKPTRRMPRYEREELEDYFNEDALYLGKSTQAPWEEWRPWFGDLRKLRPKQQTRIKMTEETTTPTFNPEAHCSDEVTKAQNTSDTTHNESQDLSLDKPTSQKVITRTPWDGLSYWDVDDTIEKSWPQSAETIMKLKLLKTSNRNKDYKAQSITDGKQGKSTTRTRITSITTPRKTWKIRSNKRKNPKKKSKKPKKLPEQYSVTQLLEDDNPITASAKPTPARKPGRVDLIAQKNTELPTTKKPEKKHSDYNYETKQVIISNTEPFYVHTINLWLQFRFDEADSLVVYFYGKT